MSLIRPLWGTSTSLSCRPRHLGLRRIMYVQFVYLVLGMLTMDESRLHYCEESVRLNLG